MLLQPAGLFPSHSGGDHGGSLFLAGNGADAGTSELTSAGERAPTSPQLHHGTVHLWHTLTHRPEMHGT